MRICKVYEHTILALGGTNEVILYEHKGNDYVHGMFKYWQTIISNDLNNFVCFESGHMHYLATSGRESALFHFLDNEFQYNSESEGFFNGKHILLLIISRRKIERKKKKKRV